jgi:hypothetical protein
LSHQLQQFLGVNELEARVNPSQALFTNARRVEVTLLKILTKLEAPLWAFKAILNWACDAAQNWVQIYSTTRILLFPTPNHN